MRELGKIVDLGEVADLGKVVNLGGGVIYPAESQGGSDNPVQRILDSMPSELRSALVAWYWPKGQGITNEYLLDGYLSEEGTSILKDLSGNGMDMELFGMTGEEGNGCVDEDGNLVFDGNDDYGLAANKISADSCIIVDVERYYNDTTRTLTILSSKIISSQKGIIMYNPSKSSAVKYKPDGGSIDVAIGEKDLIVINGKDVNGVECPSYANIQDKVCFAITRPGVLYYNKFALKRYIYFSRTLTDEEVTWVNTNMII